MTPEDQAIVDAIWGDLEYPQEIDKQTIEGIFAMAELAASRFAAGKTVITPDSDTVH